MWYALSLKLLVGLRVASRRPRELSGVISERGGQSRGPDFCCGAVVTAICILVLHYYSKTTTVETFIFILFLTLEFTLSETRLAHAAIIYSYSYLLVAASATRLDIPLFPAYPCLFRVTIVWV